MQIVYISGAGLHGWIWDGVITRLNKPNTVIDYKNKHETLDGYVEEALSNIAQLQEGRIVLVAHSVGGVIGMEIARRLGDRLAGFVAISAIIPEPSTSFVASLPFPQKLLMPLILKFAGTTPPESYIRNSLGKGLTKEQQDRVVSDFRAEGRGLYIDHTSSSGIPKIPSMYIVTTDDTEYNVKLQLSQAARLNDSTIVRVESGHLPMISHEERVTTALEDFVKALET